MVDFMDPHKIVVRRSALLTFSNHKIKVKLQGGQKVKD
jgi:hypothetical protein